LSGRRTPSDVHLIAPLGVVTRKSSDALAIDDADVSAALRFIREHACDGIDVADLLRQATVSRRVLEARFMKLLGRSPHQEILRCRLDKVKKLLAETDLPLKAIAKKSGIRHTEYMSVTFKRMTGHSPSEYRRRVRDLSERQN
jgi:LacI family transcriptional regulator